MPDSKNIETADRFIDFIFDFYSLIRRHIVEINPYRIHSHGFTMLYSLRCSTGRNVTMTTLSDMLGITKQQLTKLVNDFEESIFPKHPELSAIKQSLYDAGAVYASMSGSGSAIFGLFEDDNLSDIFAAKCAQPLLYKMKL